jgi:hypothetical protein
MTNGYMQSYFATQPLDPAPALAKNYQFGKPRKFRPQFYELRKARQQVFNVLDMMAGLGRCLRGLSRRKQRGMVSERV